jgi:hypothetical protein
VSPTARRILDACLSFGVKATVMRPRRTSEANVLCQVSYDATEQAVASEEGLPGGDDDMQRRVPGAALAALRD